MVYDAPGTRYVIPGAFLIGEKLLEVFKLQV